MLVSIQIKTLPIMTNTVIKIQAIMINIVTKELVTIINIEHLIISEKKLWQAI